MAMKRRIPVLILLAATVAAGVYYYPRFAEKPAENARLRLSGNIEAHESVLSFKAQGRIVELGVEEGQWVEAGAVLARLDDADLRQQIALDEATLRVREANLQLALAGTRPREIEAAEQTVREAEADLAQKKLDHERAQTLFKRDVISAEQRDVARTALQRAEAAHARAKERYQLAREGTRPEEIAIARRNVEQARETLGLSRVRLGFTVLRAPKAGVVLVRNAELGEVVSLGTPVVTLADLENVWLRAYIAETDLGRIRWGQDVQLKTDTFPDKTYPGRISFIASKAEFTPKSVQTQKERVTLVYRIKIDVANPNHELKPGMPADAVMEPMKQADNGSK
jgi:HlyD family secretion protein